MTTLNSSKGEVIARRYFSRRPAWEGDPGWIAGSHVPIRSEPAQLGQRLREAPNGEAGRLKANDDQLSQLHSGLVNGLVGRQPLVP